MIICDLCGAVKDCLQKEIDGKGYDIWSECQESRLKSGAPRRGHFNKPYNGLAAKRN